jgi:hypothetical protein
MMSLSCTHLFYKPLAHGLLEINDWVTKDFIALRYCLLFL